MQQDTSPEFYLQKYFGYSSFRYPQRDIVENVLSGRDTIVLMPTGGGKSMCYQLPAVMQEGLTLVISPLISLMKDQVDALRSNGIEAAFLNSSLLPEEEMLIEKKIAAQQLKLLYVSPERLIMTDLMRRLDDYRVRLIAVDEAHCISSWGHDFRPEYAQLKQIREMYPAIPMIALTATADRAVRGDISELLGLRDERMFISSFDRPNLSLTVLPARGRFNKILDIINKYPQKSGIIYCTSRNQTEKLTERLKVAGYNAACYHAGLDQTERSRVQASFIESKTDIIVATVAFGMGIDKADVRYVLHYNLPKNLESYYQEIGRAGRDGLPAETVLFYGYNDIATQMYFIEQIEDSHFRKIQEDKLKRMQEFAESHICRRKVLLAYFSEHAEADCRNCDVCRNPPIYANGTIEAQMALSAIARTREQVGMTAVIDILKGTSATEIKLQGFDKIKTFGAGRHITAANWAMSIQQFIQQGIIEVDYKDHNKLKLNPASAKVLSGEMEVKLVSYETVLKRREAVRQSANPKSRLQEIPNAALFEKLSTLRREIATSMGRLPFHIFSDASLQQMSAVLPVTHEDFLRISGVGEYKAKQFGNAFLSVITEFVRDNPEAQASEPGLQPGQAQSVVKKKKSSDKSDTKLSTLELFRQGMSVEQIAAERGISKSTIMLHLTDVYKNNPESLDVFMFVSRDELSKIREARIKLNNPDKLKPYFEFFDGKISYDALKFGLACLDTEQKD